MVSVDVGTRECDGQVVVALRGELDLVDAASVAVALTAAAAREREIIVDLAGLEFIDCSGVAALVRARKQARHAGGDLLLAAPQQQVLRLLTLTRLIDVFSVHASVDEATGSADRSRRMAAPVAGRPVRPAHGDVQAGSGGRGPQPGGPAVRGRRARCHTLRRRACRLGRTYLAPASQSAADLGTPTNPHPLIVPVGQAGASRPDRDKRAARLPRRQGGHQGPPGRHLPVQLRQHAQRAGQRPGLASRKPRIVNQRIQKAQQPRPRQLRATGKPAQPAAPRLRRSPDPRGDHRPRHPARGLHQRRPDHLHPVLAAPQHRVGKQNPCLAARPADRARRQYQLRYPIQPDDLPGHPVPPGSQYPVPLE